MAAIIAPGIGRFTLNGRTIGQPVATVLDFELTVIEGAAIDRAPWMEGVAEALWDAWVGNVMDQMNNNTFYDNVTYVDLDSATGVVGGYTPSGPAQGGLEGAALPGNVALRVNKGSVGYQRGQRAGRMYLPGLLETDTDGNNANNLTGTRLAAWQTAMTAFLTATEAIEVESLGDVSGASLVVVHTARPAPDEDPEFTGFSNVTALGVQSRVASQRRRLTL